MLEQILEYQEKDAKLVGIEREIADSNAKKVVNQMVDVVRDAKQKMVTVERNSAGLIEQFNKLSLKFEESLKEVERLSKQKFDGLSEEDLAACDKRASDANSTLLFLEKEISRLSKSITEALGEFERNKNHGVQAKKRHDQGLQAYNKLLADRQGEIDRLKRELSVLEKKVEPKLLEKYKKMREDKQFPVFVPLLGNTSCGGCSMELPTAQINKLFEKGMLECENCHRIIYVKK